jgi:Protein of unknown function (DUF3572)
MIANEANDPEQLALSALVWTLQDAARADRLLAVTGLDADTLRSRLGEPALLAGTLEFLEAHEPDLVACAADLGVRPADLVAARGRLSA